MENIRELIKRDKELLDHAKYMETIQLRGDAIKKYDYLGHYKILEEAEKELDKK